MSDSQLFSLSTLNDKKIEECIYNIRGYQVVLDSDIAMFFGVETRRLNEQMRRNADRFPEDFCFQLNSKEFKFLRSQNATLSPFFLMETYSEPNRDNSHDRPTDDFRYQ